MHEELPSDFDIIVVGTGLSESIIAAAASRIGKKVLHVDNNDYYGDLWASFNLEGLQKFIEQCKESDLSKNNDELPKDLSDNEIFIPTHNNRFIQNVLEEWYIPEKADLLTDALQKCKLSQTNVEIEPKTSDACHGDIEIQKEIDSTDVVPPSESPRYVQNNQWTQEKIMKEYRKFSIDLAPKLLYARGALVDLLISSNIARYAEFRNVSRVLTWQSETHLQEVPCSRSDVFATKQVSVVEKRMLMKLVNDILKNDGDKRWEKDEYKKLTFKEFLEKYRLTPNVIHYVLYTMAASTKETQFQDGLTRMKKFLNSLGRYGNTPFLWTMYGCGEMPQCFCRLCAVFGGTYCLNRPLKGIITDNENGVKGIYIGTQKINAQTIVMGIEKAPDKFLPFDFQNVSHCVFIINKSIKNCEKENLTYLRFPPLIGKHPCNVIEVGPAASACPNNLYLLYMYKIQENSNIKEDLKPYVTKLLSTEYLESTATQGTQTSKSGQHTSGELTEQSENLLPKALWAFYYNIPDMSSTNLKTNVPNNFHLCAGPDYEIDYEFAVHQAQQIFSEIYPTEEFLPRAPDPEEIVFEGEEAVDVGEDIQENDTNDGNVKENDTIDSNITPPLEENVSQAQEVTEN